VVVEVEEPVPGTGCAHQAELLTLAGSGEGEEQERPGTEPGEEAEERKGSRAQSSTSTPLASDHGGAPSASSRAHPSRPESQAAAEEGEEWTAAQRS
jgi:hypothetical protein